MKALTIIVLTFTCLNFWGQDTIAVYFDLGISILNTENKSELNQLPIEFNTELIDSIHFIGTADSLGNFKSNLRLSEKRAKNVSIYCSRFYPDTLKTQTFALGEQTKIGVNTRKVEVIIYSKRIEVNTNEIKTITIAKKPCYDIDYYVLNRSNLKTVTKKNKRFVRIETGQNDLSNTNIHYYGQRQDDGKFVTHKVNWEKKSTGQLWWRKKKYVATLPAAEFYKYNIFTISEPPCTPCGIDFSEFDSISNQDSCFKRDVLLLENAQQEVKFFRSNFITIRTPIEFIDNNAIYYYGGEDDTLQWSLKKGVKNEPYYFTQVPRDGNFLKGIYRKMPCCEYDTTPVDTSRILLPFCLPSYTGSGSISIDVGSYFQEDSLIPYLGLSLRRNILKGNTLITLGTDRFLSFYSSVNWNFNLFIIGVRSANGNGRWQSFGRNITSSYNVLSLYGGTEIKTHLNKTTKHLDQSIHLGLAYDRYGSKRLSKIYLQGGFGTNYLTEPFSLFPMIHLGTRWKLFNS